MFADKLLEEYRRHQEGVDPGPKLQNNVSSKVYRIKKFLGYMSEGKTNLGRLIFLNNTGRIRSWLGTLRKARITETTIHHYMKNLAQFLDYLAETPPPTCRLSKVVMVAIRREVRAMMKSMRRKMVMHQVAVKTAKEGKLIPKSSQTFARRPNTPACSDLCFVLSFSPQLA